eukprot:scaffold1793_cov163-Alexandrium_tamarense.AAC.7
MSSCNTRKIAKPTKRRKTIACGQQLNQGDEYDSQRDSSEGGDAFEDVHLTKDIEIGGLMARASSLHLHRHYGGTFSRLVTILTTTRTTMKNASQAPVVPQNLTTASPSSRQEATIA